jgi:hypothetical protein
LSDLFLIDFFATAAQLLFVQIWLTENPASSGMTVIKSYYAADIGPQIIIFVNIIYPSVAKKKSR